MVLTSLLALLFSTTTLCTPSSSLDDGSYSSTSFDAVSTGYQPLDTRWFGSIDFIYYGVNNDCSLVSEVLFSYDTNYNEKITIEVALDYSNDTYDITYSSWFHNNYNVSVYGYMVVERFDTFYHQYNFTPGYLINNSLSGYFNGGGHHNLVLSPDDYYSFTFRLYFEVHPGLDFDALVGSDYQTGYQDGYNNGYDNGYHDGALEGNQVAYDEGYAHGHRDGYNYGYVTGLNTTTYTFKDLFASVSDTPILMIRRLFGFELFGTSLMTVFVSLITALIVLMIIKKVVKR